AGNSMPARREAPTRRVMAASRIGSASGANKTPPRQSGARAAGERGGRRNGTARGPGIRPPRTRVERGILDGVTHGPHRRLAVLLDLEQRAAAHQPEVAARLALEVVVHVHVLMREADVELEALEDRPDAVAGEPEEALHAPGVDGARPHPLLDRDRLARLGTDLEVHVGERAAVQEMAEQHVLAADHRQLGARQLLEEPHAAEEQDTRAPRNEMRGPISTFA